MLEVEVFEDFVDVVPSEFFMPFGLRFLVCNYFSVSNIYFNITDHLNYLNLFFLHCDWPINVVQFEVKSTCIAHRFTLSVSSPKRCVYSITVWTFKASSASGRLLNENKNIKHRTESLTTRKKALKKITDFIWTWKAFDSNSILPLFIWGSTKFSYEAKGTKIFFIISLQWKIWNLPCVAIVSLLESELVLNKPFGGLCN